MRLALFIVLMIALPALAQSDGGLAAVIVTPNADGGSRYSVTLQVLLAMTALTLLPSALIMLTPFTRIIIILAILRQGIGLAQTPNNQILIGLALFMTFFVMAPVMTQLHADVISPYMNQEIGFTDAVSAGGVPVRAFMENQVRETDLNLFAGMANQPLTSDGLVPMRVLIPAFITSELKTAFQIGFLLLLPFLIIDLVVASVLMSMGMVMLSPLVISLPFKLMLFVMVDGWTLVLGTLSTSFVLPGPP